MRPAAYAMSLWPFSSSTSNIALGRACETVASMTTACSFWSPSSRSVRRAFGVRVPRRGPRCLPKFRKSLIGEGQVSFPSRMAFPSPNNFRSLLRLAAVDITPLRRHRDYRLLYFGRFVSLFGNQITFVAVPYQVFTLTHSTFAVGLLGVVELAALLPRLVDRDELAAAAARGSMRSTLEMIAGPALAGILIAVAGLPVAYVVDIATFVVGLVCLWLMKAVPPPADAERPSIRRIAEGLRYARSRPELLGTYFVDIIAMFFGMPIALFPAIAAGYGGAKVLGLLYAAVAVGSFLFSATSGWTRNVHRHGRAVVVAATLWGFAIMAFGFSTALVVALLCLVAAGAADMMSGIFRNVIWNQTIPDSLRGRLASIELLSFSGGPLLGNFESGVVASLFSVRFSVVSGGVLCVVGCAFAVFALPAFWRYDARTWKAA